MKAALEDAQNFANKKGVPVTVFKNIEGNFICRESMFCEPSIEVVGRVEPKTKKSSKKELF